VAGVLRLRLCPGRLPRGVQGQGRSLIPDGGGGARPVAPWPVVSPLACCS
jgi:hypothetical protein